MPITPFLSAEDHFDAETRRIMAVAFVAALAALRLEDRSDPFTEVVARKIIELAKAGESNCDLLCERALSDPTIRLQIGLLQKAQDNNRQGI
jgi:hypothetical protein